MVNNPVFHDISELMDAISGISAAATKQAMKDATPRPDTKPLENLRGRLLRLKTKAALRDQNPDAPDSKYVMNEDPQLFFSLKSLFKNDEELSAKSSKLARHCLGANSNEIIELGHIKPEEADPSMASIADLAAKRSSVRYR